MAKMTDKITVPLARASIIWLIGEYSDRVSKLAPDVLRKSVKSFCDEDNVVKLQILNLAAKLHVSNTKQVSLLVQYVFNLAKYDQNYDIRDRARYFRTLIYNNEKCPVLAKHLKKIILAPKPAPILESSYKGSDQYQLGTLSHAISSRVTGYADLPQFPLEAPDQTVRNVEVPVESRESQKSDQASGSRVRGNNKKKSEKFYSDDESESQSTEGADPTNDEDEDDESDGSETESETSDTEKTVTKKSKIGKNAKESDESDESSDDSEESSEESDSETSESSSSEDDEQTVKKVEKVSKSKPNSSKKIVFNLFKRIKVEQQKVTR